MSFAYKRISSLGTSHDPSAYMADLGCRSSTREKEKLVPIQVWRSRKRQLNGVKSVIYSKLQDNLLDKLFYLSTLGSMAAMHMWRSLVTKVGTTKELAQAAACHIRNLS